MKRHIKYLWYVIRHKWFVLIAGLTTVPIWQLILHDWHKFLPDEWFAYARTFYAPDGAKQYEPTAAFDIAWLKHQNRAPHHWQYWILLKDGGEVECLPMPDRYWREMIADWKGAGRALDKPDYQKWYARNRDKIQLHPDTRQKVDKALRVNFSEEQLRVAEITSSVENWPVNTLHEAALDIYRSDKRRLAMSLGLANLKDWEL